MEEAVPIQPPDLPQPEIINEQHENEVPKEQFNIEDLEKELNQRHSFEEKEWNFEADFKDLEKALDDESVQYTNEEAERVAGQLEEVRVALESTGVNVEEVLKDFHIEIEEDMLHVSSVNAEDLLQEEKRRMDSELERARHEAEIQRRREQILEERAAEARKELNDETKKKIALISEKKKLLLLKARLEQEKMEKAFSQAESQLNKAIEERQAEVKTLYGDLRIASEQYGGARDRRWRVEWTRTPQPIQIKIDCVRGLKDKIPIGKYGIMVSLYDRLGGHPMQWSKLESKRWGNSTLPVAHTGKFFAQEMKVDQSVYTVAPAKVDLKPGMILTFELFLLRGSQSPTDVAVAWGAFPICDANFDIISGKFKAPLLRGHMDSQVDRHERIEQLISADLDHWLANIYFEIVRLPRFLAGQKEYEVELQFTSGLLNSPDRLKTNEPVSVDGEPVLKVLDEKDNYSSLAQSKPQELLKKEKSQLGLSRAATYLSKASFEDKEVENSKTIKTMTIGSRMAISKMQKAEGSDYDTDDEEDWEAVEGADGLYYKHHYTSPALKYSDQVTALLPKNEAINKILERSQPKKYNHLETLEQHRFSVMNEYMKSTREVIGVGRERLTYCSRMFRSELGISQVRTIEFWTFMLLVVLIFFPRVYIHYIGQWMMVNAAGFPPAKFEFLPWTVELSYQEDRLSTGMTVGVVLMGPLFNILVFSLLAFFAFLFIRLSGAFPGILSKTILIYGIWCILDPAAILIVDCILGRFGTDDAYSNDDIPIGDAFKIYWHFKGVSGNGVVGIPITIFVYLVLMLLASTVLYVYFLKLHNNGRLLDTYHRLHGEDEDYVIPFDLEISAKELAHICRKSENWRGNEGETRKTVVNDFIWEEEDDESEDGTSRKSFDERFEDFKREVTVHVAIFTVHLDGLREIYRQFLRLPSGAIIEVFGDISNAKLLPDVKVAVMRKQNNYEEAAVRKPKSVEKKKKRAPAPPPPISPELSRAASMRSSREESIRSRVSSAAVSVRSRASVRSRRSGTVSPKLEGEENDAFEP